MVAVPGRGKQGKIKRKPPHANLKKPIFNKRILEDIGKRPHTFEEESKKTESVGRFTSGGGHHRDAEQVLSVNELGGWQIQKGRRKDS